ncbi:MAG: SDR family oxidoreductase [Microcella sp.]|uniref:SDR family NAD(P)-dependent oxidoreductase n=1 Tax=Microcella sp. TaxID=1913979 RepID=UPI0024C78217|nr:SDR family NAD(P)-dependent oxidoreductase [Microcella sp.]UYN82970.1 MAG: SDR family oxidoreductase [Microcella sp.]
MSDALAGRTIVVAGAGGVGGRSVCAALTAAGAHVVAVGSRAESLSDVDAAETAVVDLADPSAVAAWAAELRGRRPSIDGLLHLVGGWRGGSDPDDFDWLERRVLTTLRVASRELRDDLGASSAGRVAIVSSASVAAPKWGMANYVTLKAAAEMWMQALASGWRTKQLPAAAVTFVVGALDEPGAVDDLAAACAALWSVGHEQLNGALVDLSTRE